MKIAVTFENEKIFQHFGHTKKFKIYNIEDGKIVSSQVLDTDGRGHGALAGFLFDIGIDVLICGGIGGGAQNALAKTGIKTYGGVSGECDAAVNAFLVDDLNFDPDVKCSHHGEGHNCDGGNHNCSEHSCH